MKHIYMDTLASPVLLRRYCSMATNNRTGDVSIGSVRCCIVKGRSNSQLVPVMIQTASQSYKKSVYRRYPEVGCESEYESLYKLVTSSIHWIVNKKSYCAEEFMI
jgi:hypothetical protein